MEWLRIVPPDAIRLFLLAGLVVHKLTWEILKRRISTPATAALKSTSPPLRMVKLGKVGFLLGLIVQTAMLEVLPIASDPETLRYTGLTLFSAGLLIAIGARLTLGNNWSDIEDSLVLPDHRIVERGIYRFIRHPIYVGDLLLIAGLELALNSWLVLGVLLLTPIVLRRAIGEEKILCGAFPEYARYCNRTKRFIPFVV